MKEKVIDNHQVRCSEIWVFEIGVHFYPEIEYVIEIYDISSSMRPKDACCC